MSKMPMPRLGKGLESLIPKTALTQNRGISQISLEEIIPNEYQPRLYFNPEALEQLSNSIKTHGLAQPIVVRKKENGYELIAGERRFRASKLAGLTSIPAIIKEVSDKEALQLAMVENIDREDLNPMEEAKGYQRLVDEFEMTHQRVSEIFGRSRSAITNTLRLLQLPLEIQEDVAKKNLSEGHARVLLSVESDEKRKELAKKIKEEQWSVRQLERYLSEGNESVVTIQAPQEIVSEPIQQLNLFSNLETQLSTELGVKVQMKGNPKKGSIQLRFSSQEQLQSILTILRAQSLLIGQN